MIIKHLDQACLSSKITSCCLFSYSYHQEKFQPSDSEIRQYNDSWGFWVNNWSFGMSSLKHDVFVPKLFL